MLKRLYRGQLSPVGEPISFVRASGERPLFSPSSYECSLLSSGTAALSLAMSIAAESVGRPGGEVILPAYGCPDLLSATYYAGLRPVLVDIGACSHRYDRTALERALSPNCVAIVAVNFLGISEDLAYLSEVAGSRGLALIEDNAQFVPTELTAESYRGDLVVHSFGRGKPVPQLSGGALLSNDRYRDLLRTHISNLGWERAGERSWRIRALLFNLVLQPLAYQFLLKLPGLDIGSTRYKPLEEICRWDSWHTDRLQVNLDLYMVRSRHLQMQLDLALEALAKSSLINLPRSMGCQHQALLRYPLLCQNRPQRDALYRALMERGLGASVMYGERLNRIENLPAVLPGEFPGASHFAERLITLPLTSFVSSSHLAAMIECVDFVL